MLMQAGLAVLLSKLGASPEVPVGFAWPGAAIPGSMTWSGFSSTPWFRAPPGQGSHVRGAAGPGPGAQPVGATSTKTCPSSGWWSGSPPARSLARHPLVQVILAGQNLPGQDNNFAAGLALGDLQVTPLPVDTRTARMDLVFFLAERWTQAGDPAGIGGMVEFRTDVFDADSIEALIGRLERVLVATTADPARRLSSIDMLDEAEQARLDGVGQPGGVHPARTAGGVDSGVVRRPSRAHARRGGADLRGPLDDVSGTRGGG